ncbi:hypothetical protein F3Y22_tig00110503pilonHSYRG00758 [Hibiscus syriacus]|uniref:Uncharacterized protein n=1 Tax=Hibiscus syriacus TaxID=106335 RepID=A0A6A3ADF9_HIBSY|nr:hypothetical protein F3Y22_tig00110503pilonHSYRG00758 [Hibiscus syriacus]
MAVPPLPTLQYHPISATAATTLHRTKSTHLSTSFLLLKNNVNPSLLQSPPSVLVNTLTLPSPPPSDETLLPAATSRSSTMRT